MRDYTPWRDAAQSPIFWVMYAMFVLVGAGGLMATAQLAPIAQRLPDRQGPGQPDRHHAAGADLRAVDRPRAERVTRPFFGWVSDHIGRENTMFIAFALEAVGIWALSAFGHDPVLFVILSGLVFFAWGEIYSLFPSTCTDTYGAKYATTNAGLLYTAKGTASLLVPFANVLAQETGGWHAVFIAAAAMNVVAALAAPFVLRPLRNRHKAAQAAGVPPAPAPRPQVA